MVPVEPVRMQGRGTSTGVKGGPAAHQAIAPRPEDVAVVGAGQPGNNNSNNAFSLVPDNINPVRTHVVWTAPKTESPILVPLFDDNVRSCYWARTPTPGYPMHCVRDRPDAVFFPLLAEHLVRDLTSQPELWARLAELAPKAVTPLRLLDSIAWGIGGKHAQLLPA